MFKYSETGFNQRNAATNLEVDKALNQRKAWHKFRDKALEITTN